MKYLLTVVFLFTIVYKSSADECHMNQIDVCVASLIFNQESSGVPTNEEGVNEFCGYVDETYDCLRPFKENCMSPVHREIFMLVAEGFINTMDDLCTEGSKLSVEYLEHAECLAEVHDDEAMQNCRVDMQAAIETVTSVKFDKRIGTLCCGIRRYMDCGEKLTEEKCGPEAVAMARKISQLAVTEFANTVCQSFDPECDQCKELLPPKGTVPNGSESKSQISNFLAMYFGGN